MKAGLIEYTLPLLFV